MLRGGLWQPRRANWLDLAALILIVAIMLLLGSGARQMLAPFVAAQPPQISLSPDPAELRAPNRYYGANATSHLTISY